MISLPPAIHAAAPVNADAFLLAVALVETADAQHPHGNDNALGLRGERTRWAILPATWNRFCEYTPSKASAPQRHRVAESVLKENRAVLDRRGFPLTVHNLALAWKCGPHFEHTSRDAQLYAARVEAIYGATFKP